MNLMGAALGGALGAVLGGVVWVVVGYTTHYEVGFIAWGVGVAAGMGAAIGSKQEGGQAAGVIAAILAIASILVSKYIVIELLVEQDLSQAPRLTTADIPGPENREYWVVYVADRLIEDRQNSGQFVTWPAGVNPDEANKQSDYPPEIWKDAAARWDAMSSPARSEYRDQAAASIAENYRSAVQSFTAQAKSEGFFQSFSLFDLLWGFLAIASAFRLGAGGIGGKSE